MRRPYLFHGCDTVLSVDLDAVHAIEISGFRTMKNENEHTTLIAFHVNSDDYCVAQVRSDTSVLNDNRDRLMEFLWSLIEKNGTSRWLETDLALFAADIAEPGNMLPRKQGEYIEA